MNRGLNLHRTAQALVLALFASVTTAAGVRAEDGEVAAETTAAPAIQPAATAEAETPFTFWSKPMPLRSGLAVGAYYLTAEPDQALAGRGWGAGISLEGMARRGGAFFQAVGRVRLGFALGAANFTVDSAEQNLRYQLVHGDAALGLRINLLPSGIASQAPLLQPYFEVDGKISLNALLLPGLEGSSTEVTRTNSGRAMGIDWIAGLEFREQGFVEFQLRGGAGTVGSLPEFQVGSAALVFGLLW